MDPKESLAVVERTSDTIKKFAERQKSDGVVMILIVAHHENKQMIASAINVNSYKEAQPLIETLLRGTHEIFAEADEHETGVKTAKA